MPVYEYRCRDCSHEFEINQSMSEDSLTVCPECDGALKKVFAPVGIAFKGSGFYKNDARGKSSSGAGSSKSSGSNGSGSESSSSNGSGSSDSSSESSSGTKSSSGDSGSGSSSKKPAPANT